MSADGDYEVCLKVSVLKGAAWHSAVFTISLWSNTPGAALAYATRLLPQSWRVDDSTVVRLYRGTPVSGSGETGQEAP